MKKPEQLADDLIEYGQVKINGKTYGHEDADGLISKDRLNQLAFESICGGTEEQKESSAKRLREYYKEIFVMFINDKNLNG